MRLIHVLFLSDAGGCERLCLTALSASTFEHALLLANDSGPLASALLEEADLSVRIPEPTLRRPWLLARFAKAVKVAGSQGGEHVILWHGRRNLLPTLVALRLAGHQGPVHVHIGTVVEPLGWAQRLQTRALRGLQRRLNFDVVAPSSAVAVSVKRFLGLRNIRIVRNAVSVPEVPQTRSEIFSASEAQGGSEKDARAILSVSRFDDSKDQATLIKALDLLRREGLELTAILVGTGPLAASVEQLARDLKVRSAHFVGVRTRPYDVATVSDVFFFGTHPREGFGLALWEAIGAGMTVVASRTPAALDAAHVGDINYYEYGNVASLAETLRNVALKRHVPRRAIAPFGATEMLEDYIRPVEA